MQFVALLSHFGSSCFSQRPNLRGIGNQPRRLAAYLLPLGLWVVSGLPGLDPQIQHIMGEASAAGRRLRTIPEHHSIQVPAGVQVDFTTPPTFSLSSESLHAMLIKILPIAALLAIIGGLSYIANKANGRQRETKKSAKVLEASHIQWAIQSCILSSCLVLPGPTRTHPKRNEENIRPRLPRRRMAFWTGACGLHLGPYPLPGDF